MARPRKVSPVDVGWEGLLPLETDLRNLAERSPAVQAALAASAKCAARMVPPDPAEVRP